MDVQYPPWTRRYTRMIYPLLSVCLIFSMVVGGTLGPWLLPPTQSQAASLSGEINSIDIGKEEQSQFSPDLRASYGEVITYTVLFTVTPGYHSSIVITDTFGNPPGATYLPVTPSNSLGPFPITPGAPDPTDVTPVVTWPQVGRPVLRWALLEPIDSSGDWVFGISYRAWIADDGNLAASRKAHSTASVDWAEGGPITDTAFDVTLVEPRNFTLNKSQDPPTSTELGAGQLLTWTITMRNLPGSQQSTAYDLLITDTMPTRTLFDSWIIPPTVSAVLSGTQVLFSTPQLNVSSSDTVLRIKADVPQTKNVAHGTLRNAADLHRTSAPGDAPGERGYDSSTSVTGYIRNINLNKAQVSKIYYNDSATQAVAGEYVTVTVDVGIPKGLVIYNPVVRILLKDGLTFTNPLGTTPWYNDVKINPGDQDPARPNPGSTYWTQYEWNQLASITNTDSGPLTRTFSFLAQARQSYFLPANPGYGSEIPHNTLLDIVPIVRWADHEGGDFDVLPTCDTGLCKRNTTSNPTVSTQFIRPDLRYKSATSGSYFTTSGSFQGNGILDFTLHLRNDSGSPAYPTAYDIVLQDTLSPDLTYTSASPPPDSVITGPGGTTLAWTLTTPISNNTMLFDIYATLPPTMVVGLTVTSTAHARYTTFAGTWPAEGSYYDAPPADPSFTARAVLQGGFLVKKYVSPANNVRIGDTVDYTLVMTVNPGMIMYLPTFDDTLPKGFHYVPDSFTVQNGQLLTGSLFITGTGSPNWQQVFGWGLLTVDNLDGTHPTVVMNYQATLTGVDYRGAEPGMTVYASSRSDLVNALNARNQVGVCWESSKQGGITYCLVSTSEPYAETKVVQPYLADSPPWNKVLASPYITYEVGDQVYFKVTLRNAGQGTAYDLVLADTLPLGIAITDTTWTVTPPSPPVDLVTPPPYGATGDISWVFDQLAPGQTLEVSYRTQVISSAIPGDWLTNLATIVDYTSQPGSPTYDRHYAAFDGDFPQDPIPPGKSCAPFKILGLGLRKTDWPDPVEAGGFLTYTLYFSNTSGRYSTYDVVITDTYDPNITYLGVYEVSDPRIQPLPLIPPRTLRWTKPFIYNNDPTEYWIRIHFRVNQPLAPSDSPLVNWAAVDGLGDRTGPVERIEETTVDLPVLTIRKSGTPNVVSPAGFIDYTIYFTNTGAAAVTATSVLVREIYDPNVTFISANPSPIAGTTDTWSWADLGQGDYGSIQVQVQVDKPVPAGLAYIFNQASISCAQVTATLSPQIMTELNVPVMPIYTVDWPDPVNPGNPLRYTLYYTNTGTTDAHNVVLTDTLDPNVTFAAASPPPDGGTCPSQRCVWHLGTLYAGSHNLIVLDVTVNGSIPPGVSRLVNHASMASDEVGPNMDTEYTDLPYGGSVIYLPLIYKSAPGQ